VAAGYPAALLVTIPLLLRCVLARSTISGNVHLTGAVLRCTDGMSLTSIRSSHLSDNIATAVVRLEGRAWVQHLQDFMDATRSLDIDLFTNSVENTSPATYFAYYLPKHKKAQVLSSSFGTFHIAVDCVQSIHFKACPSSRYARQAVCHNLKHHPHAPDAHATSS
jgi:hypothetical protein